MIGGRSSNRWLGGCPGVVAIIATIGLGVPAYAQRPPSGGGHATGTVSRPPVPARSMPVGPRVQPPVKTVQQQQDGRPPQQQRPLLSPGPQKEGGAGAEQQQGTGDPRIGGGGVSGHPITGGQTTGGQSTGGEGLPTGTRVTPRVPHPPPMRRWPLPQGATEADRPPPGQCRVWLGGVPASRQPAPTSCGQAAKMRTPGSTLIFGDDKP